MDRRRRVIEFGVAQSRVSVFINMNVVQQKKSHGSAQGSLGSFFLA